MNIVDMDAAFPRFWQYGSCTALEAGWRSPPHARLTQTLLNAT